MLIALNTVARLPLLFAHIVQYHRIVHGIELTDSYSGSLMHLATLRTDAALYIAATVILWLSSLYPVHRYADGFLHAVGALLCAFSPLALIAGLLFAFISPFYGILMIAGILGVIAALLLQEPHRR